MIDAVVHPSIQPAMRIISSITNGYPAIVTTTFEHNYIDKMIVRLNIPEQDGMTEANHLFGEIVVIDPTSFAIDIDTTDFGVFVDNFLVHQNSRAQVTPIGENNDTLRAATQNVLPQEELP
jgi:hypothetical protein